MEQIGDSRPGKEGGGGRGGGGGVNDMYTQTGRIGRKEGKIARKTKPSAAGRTAEGTTARGCLGPSDDSQSSCLLASRFPFLDGYAVYVPLPPACPLLPSSLPPPPPPPPPPLCLSSRVSLFCSSRTHRCGTSIVLKWFHLIAPLPRQPRYSLHGTLNGRDTRVSENFLC